MRPSTAGAARMAMAVLVLIVGPACKLDSLVFGIDAVDAYHLPATAIPDSLRREVSFPSGSETLYGYWLRQGGSAPRLTVVFSHGKGGNLSEDVKWAHAEHLWQAGFDVLTYDYRGFGRSTGTSKDETTLAADASAALAFALAQPGVTIGRVVSYGHSLGSDPAIALAAANAGIRALVVESGFSNGQAMAQSADPLGFPVSWLMREPMLNTTRIATVQMPVLILHGSDDLQIPPSQGRALYDAAHEPKAITIVPGAGHETVEQVMGLPAFRALIRQFTNATAP
ncbi:MAG: alpha/beta hydrolase [Gemmatimonadaceae bacterium]